MTTATILDKGFSNGRAEFQVEIFDGVDSVKKNYTPDSLESLKRSVANDIKNFDANKAFVETIELGKIDPTIPSVVLSPQDVARSTWLNNYRKLVRAKTTLVDTGVITVAQPQYAALLATVKSGLLAEYLNDI